LKAYNIYVKRKEKDLRDMIEKLNLKNSNNTLKDEKINMLEKIIQSFRDDQVRVERERESKNQALQRLEAKAEHFQQEKDFLHKQVLESKRQNKLLKLAIQRLQD
jgi:hypothetical protein